MILTPVERHIGHRDLVKIWNDRGAVICAADVSPLVARGVVKSYESSAEYQMIEVDGERVEIGGCLNTLTSSRPQSRGHEQHGAQFVHGAGRALAGRRAFCRRAPRSSLRVNHMNKWNLIVDVARCENCNNCDAGRQG